MFFFYFCGGGFLKIRGLKEKHREKEQKRKNKRERGTQSRIPLWSQGEFMFQHGVENNMESPETVSFCSFSSSASSLMDEERGKEDKKKFLSHQEPLS